MKTGLGRYVVVKGTNGEKGSLALEHVLFIGAIVALSTGIFVFYDNLSTYFSSISFAKAPTSFGSKPSSN